MDTKEIQQLVEIITKCQPTSTMSVWEVLAAVIATVGCLVTTYAFIRSVINNGFDLIKLQNANQNTTLEKQDKTLNEISQTLMNYKLDTVKHRTCAERQENLIKRLNLDDLKDRVKTLEERANGNHDH